MARGGGRDNPRQSEGNSRATARAADRTVVVKLPEERQLRGTELPPRLADMPRLPEVLYLRGELPRGPAVAIVGTRGATDEALAFTRELAGELATSGVAIFSGGAAGIDTAAHRGALDVGGPTVVVAPSGSDCPYPPENAELFREVLRTGGALVSAVPRTEPAARHRFFERNAILATLAHALVVVQCPFRSGTRTAAAAARRAGRPVFVVPQAPYCPQGRGCVAELQLGAKALLSHRDVLRLLAQSRIHAVPLPLERSVRIVRAEGEPGSNGSREPKRAARKKGGGSGRSRQGNSRTRGPANLPLRLEVEGDPESKLVLEAVRGGATHASDVCEQTGLGPARVQHLILTLTLRGVLLSDQTGQLKLAWP